MEKRIGKHNNELQKKKFFTDHFMIYNNDNNEIQLRIFFSVFLEKIFFYWNLFIRLRNGKKFFFVR